jgi:hypothetical protein
MNGSENCVAPKKAREMSRGAGHDLIHGELPIGDIRGRAASYLLMHRIPDVRHEEVVEFVGGRNLYGRGIGWIDAHLLASCLVAGVPLWTADDRLNKMADDLGIRYIPAHRRTS